MQDVFTGVFFLIFVGTFATGIWTTFARKRAAQRMAIRAGLNPQDAGATAMLGGDGLDTAYLVSATRPGYAATAAEPAVTASPVSVEERLRELTQLRAEGLVSDAEYEAQHKLIVSSI